MSKSGKKVLGYARLSKAEAGRSELGLDGQAAAIEAACAAKGWDLIEVIRDDGFSGKTLDRPGLSKALEAIAVGESDGLVAAKLDRVSRSVIDFGSLIEWMDEAGAALVALDLSIDTSTPQGRLIAHVLVSVAQWERETIAQRTKDKLALIRESGKPISRPAVADNPDLRKRIVAMRKRGKSMQAIADTLNDQGVPTLRGGLEWRPSSVQSIAGKRRKPKRKVASLPKIRAKREIA